MSYAALIVVAALFLLLARAMFRTSATRKAYLERRAEIENIPFNEARRRAEEVTAGWKKELNASGAVPQFDESLAPLTHEFVSTVAELASPNGVHLLGAKYLARSRYRPELLKIGQSDYRDICVLPGSDVVQVIDGADSVEDDTYPSVHHLLLDYAATERWILRKS